MGFNIGSLIGAVAPALGAVIGGPPGAAIGSMIGAGAQAMDPPRAQAAIGRQTQPGPVSVSATSVVPPTSMLAMPPVSQAAPSMAMASTLPQVIRRGTEFALGTGLGYMLNGNGNGKTPLQQILARARAATGGPVIRNKIIDAAKTCGLSTAAQTFGISVQDVCQVVVRGRTRRRRGISAADIRRTKRTIYFASKIRKDLKVLAR